MTISRQQIQFWAALLIVMFILSGATSAQQAFRNGNRSAAISTRERDHVLSTLPDIRKFLSSPSDQFLVDLDQVSSGHPYKGKNARHPHTGGHVYFRLLENPIGETEMNRFPAIYAVADGVISRVDYSFRLREIKVSDPRRKVANTRYGIGLLIAASGGHPVEMHYSIEPFVDPGDAEFYDRFLLVRVGQRVKKGEVIARMFLPRDPEIARNSHIHFNMLGGKKRTFLSPSIFNKRIVNGFHKTWVNRRGTDDGVLIPPCMGYKLAPEENPFGSGEKAAL